MSLTILRVYCALTALPDLTEVSGHTSKTMNTTKTGSLSKKDIARRWNVSCRSVERAIKRYRIVPDDWFGRQPEFTVATVERMESQRRTERLAQISHAGGGVVTVKQAKALAKKGGKR
jgi:transposase